MWMHEHPYLFCSMFAFTLMSVMGTIIEVTKIISSGKVGKKQDE